MKFSYLLLLVFAIVFMTGCRKNWIEIDAKEHSQYIMEHLHDDTAAVFFPQKYFPQEKMNLILTNLRSQCNKATRKGGYKDSYYISNIGGTDQVTFTYEYVYDCSNIRFQMTYNIYWRSYELKSFYITDFAEAGGK